tara:strand:+ start:438 stop:584 length:147 start_codon:yes stop_codon:yes gene_type:complete
MKKYKVTYSTGIGFGSRHDSETVLAFSREEARDIMLQKVRFVNTVKEI